MIKRTLEISREPYHVSVQLDQLKLCRVGEKRDIAASIPCEDIGIIVVDEPGTTYSHAALARLVEYGAAVLICDRRHLPAGLLLPMANHSQVVWRLQDQIAISRPLQKQLWQQIVAAKIRNQAGNLDGACPARIGLLAMARAVRSGDPDNLEAQAARIYWSAWLDGLAFQRDPDDASGVNAQLNYGYAIVRAAVARALVGAGLHPALGLKHANRGNAFCLADDFMEPLRPLVDRAVRDLVRQNERELNPAVKKRLLALLTATVRLGETTGPLLVALPRVAASFVQCLEGAAKKLLLPDWEKVEEEKSLAGAQACT